MRLWRCLSLTALGAHIACSSLFGEESPAVTQERISSIQEGMALRRIAEYWKEKDFAATKRQILDFLEKYGSSTYTDNLYAMLGDILFQEKDFTHAALTYARIQDEAFRHKAAASYAQCLFELERYEEVCTHASNALETGRVEGASQDTLRFLLAESLFRQAMHTQEVEKRQELMLSALPHFKRVLQTTYRDYALYPLAETYKLLKDYPSAASFYLALAEKYSEKKEEYLFQAALLQVQFDKGAAVDTFEKVYLLEGKRAKEAAFNQMSLLFRAEKYKELIAIHKQALKHVPAEHYFLMQYYVGRSLFALKDYQNAIKPLSEYAQAKEQNVEEFKNTLLCLIVCAHERQDFPLYERTLKQLKSTFPQDFEVARALQLHAQDCREAGNLKGAKASLKEILGNYPDHPEKEALLYDYSLLLMHAKEWEEAEGSLSFFLKQYPDSKFAHLSWRQLLCCVSEQLKAASVETLRSKKEHYAEILSAIVEQEKALSSAEKEQAHLSLARVFYDLEHYEDALGVLHDYLEKNPKQQGAASAHFLIALCHKKSSESWPLFALHAEKALSLDPKLPGAGLLHVELYNAYLALTEQKSSESKSSLMEKAAEHLYQAILEKSALSRLENQIWLADYYHQKVKSAFQKNLTLPEDPQLQLAFDRAVFLFEKLIGAPEITFSEGTMDREAEVLKLSELLTYAHRHAEKIALLETLAAAQSSAPHLPWKWQRFAQFELGKALAAVGETDRALKVYGALIASSQHTFSFYATAAQFEEAKLKYHQLASRQKLGEEGTDEILDTLKDLQINRKLGTEPLHLEAALEYIAIKASLLPEEQKESGALFLFEKLEREWTSPEDPETKEYLAATEQFPEKRELVQMYLHFIHAEACRLESLLAQKRGEKEKSRELANTASKTLESLLASAPALSPPLAERAQRSMETLKRSL